MTQKAVFYIFSIKKSLLGGYLEKAKMRHHASRLLMLNENGGIMKAKNHNEDINYLQDYSWGPRYAVALDVKEGAQWNPCMVSFRRTIINANYNGVEIIGLVSIGPDMLENEKLHDEIFKILAALDFRLPFPFCICRHSMVKNEDIIFYYTPRAQAIFMAYGVEITGILLNLTIPFDGTFSCL